MRTSLELAVVLVLAVAVPLAAQPLDPASAAALDATVRLLQDPAQRGAAVGGSPAAAAVDKQMQTVLTSPELQQEFYSLAADIFAELVLNAGGDASKVAQALETGRTDPAGFAARLSPGTLERLRALSIKIDKTR